MIRYNKFVFYSFCFLIFSSFVYSSEQEKQSFEYVSEFLPNNEDGNPQGGFRIIKKPINKTEETKASLEKAQ